MGIEQSLRRCILLSQGPLMTDPSESDLRHLYLDQGVSESEIAQRFGTYQVRINRLRKKYGIPTIGKADRLKLPPLTARQHSILRGSMLGDGRLFKTGPSTAALSEYHSLKQEDYLRWKAQEWGPYVKSIRPVEKTDGGRTYQGLVLRTHGCRQFHKHWGNYYPLGSGNKTFVQTPKRLTALALAIWYLDDGSKTWNGYARFAVTPDKSDTEHQLALLEALGLDPTFHENLDGSDPAIWIHNRTALTKFLDLVTPHIPECMAYKVDFKARSRGTAPRHLLTESLLRTFTSQGWGSNRISKAMSVSVNSVRAALDRHNFPRPELGRPAKVQSALTFEEVRSVVQNADLTKDQLVELLIKLPPPPPPSREEIQRDWSVLKSLEVDLSNPRPGNQGQRLCHHFFPHRQDATYESLPSLSRAWFDPVWVRKAILFQERVGGLLHPRNVHRALRAILRAPTNFRPALAKSVVMAYCPEGGLVLDPCAGYGGRAAGTLASGRAYLGVDPHPQAKEAYAKMQSIIGSFRFESSTFEEVDLSGVSADLVFTSPPYYAKERYSDDATQSWVRYPTWGLWLAGFLQPFIEKSWAALKPSGAFVVNTKNIKIGRKAYPIVDELKIRALKRGFSLEADLEIKLGFLGGKSGSVEPLLVFRKP